MKLFSTIVTLVAGVALSVRAHDLVLIPAGNGHELNLRIKFGHAQEWEPPEIHRLYYLSAFPPQTNGGEISWLSGLAVDGVDLLAKAGSSSPAPSGTWVIAGSYDNGFWVHADGGILFNTDNMEYPSATNSGHYIKYAKALIFHGSLSADYKRVIGSRVELVPVSDPFSIKVGQFLPIQALYEGKPLVGVGLEIGDGKTKIKEEDIPRYKTNAQGIAQVPITHGGVEVIAVDYKTPSRTPDASADDNYSSTLTFIASPSS
jgi:nickel transport protein